MTVVGILVLKKIVAGSPITISIAPSSNKALRMVPSALPRKSTHEVDDDHNTIVLFQVIVTVQEEGKISLRLVVLVSQMVRNDHL